MNILCVCPCPLESRSPTFPVFPALGFVSDGPCCAVVKWRMGIAGLTRAHPLQFVLFGANDACVPLPTNFQHVPLDKFKENLARIVTHPNILAHKPKIFLITPPPLDEIRLTVLDLAAGHHKATRHARVSSTYSDAVRQVAAEQGVTLVDLWKALMDRAIEKTPAYDPRGPALGDPEGGIRGHLEALLPDGLHLSSESYRIFYDLVRPLVGTEWADKPEEDRFGWVLPEWRSAPWLDEDSHLRQRAQPTQPTQL